MSIRVHTFDGRVVEAPCAEGDSLARAIWLAPGLRPPALCSGLGRCGRCRVRFLSTPPPPADAEKLALSPEELAADIRLACRHPATPGTEVRLFPAAAPVRARLRPDTGEALLLAVDFGTTSLHWRALARSGALAAEGRELNPQMGAGSEIMSRLAAAGTPQGRARLAGLARAALDEIIRALPGAAAECCIAANPAMTAIVLEREVEGLSRAPYRLDYAGGSGERIAGLPPLWIPPQLAPFVGGDVSAGMAFTLARMDPDYPFLLADMGTNGEFVLALGPDRALAASVPLGPALEGIGLRHGNVAEEGAAHAFSLGPAGLHISVIGGGEARSVCATGYLSLISILLRHGLLSPEGAFRREARTPLAGLLAGRLREGARGLSFRLTDAMDVDAHDVEAVLAVKAAFSLTLERLLAHAGVSSARLRRAYIAGALGSHANADDLEALGFFPAGLGARLTPLGNSSLAGAELFLLEPAWRERIARWARGCSTPDLAAEGDFQAGYMRHMRFAW
ncbi:MAG: ASKHA domain-containing protein [Deltaproteobacteria bacterium]|jgi:uncharacterized 2Fe-2S/4Fe-4S cluster protein (DUF4445 family)|nr:ASKHA domain-containing protein [Deltaproteobacteria bacterium]